LITPSEQMPSTVSCESQGIHSADLSLGAILINPPLGDGGATLRHLEILRRILQCKTIKVANLLPAPTRSVIEITSAGELQESWQEARPSLLELLDSSNHIVLGWGLGGGFSGPARRHFASQVQWVERAIRRQTKPISVWTVGGQPRHPSRWHQYVSDVHGRTSGGSFDQRLQEVLVKQPMARLAECNLES
jgi:hypothetical protein